MEIICVSTIDLEQVVCVMQCLLYAVDLRIRNSVENQSSPRWRARDLSEGTSVFSNKSRD
jgi:hypothetical protein